MERCKGGTKKSHWPNQNTILINIIWYYFMRYAKIKIKFNEQKIKWT